MSVQSLYVLFCLAAADSLVCLVTSLAHLAASRLAMLHCVRVVMHALLHARNIHVQYKAIAVTVGACGMLTHLDLLCRSCTEHERK